MSIFLIVIAIIVYINIGSAVGLKAFEKLEQNPRHEDYFDREWLSVIYGIFWPVIAAVLLCTLSIRLPRHIEKWREEKKAKALPPAKSDPISGARELRLLQEKKAELESALLKVGEDIRDKQGDSEVDKVINLPKRF